MYAQAVLRRRYRSVDSLWQQQEHTRGINAVIAVRGVKGLQRLKKVLKSKGLLDERKP
jgi:enoyl reductase-like protein